MLFFHQEINKRIAKHIAELDRLGLIPHNWKWQQEKIKGLDRIDQTLLDDLTILHKKYKNINLPELPHIEGLLQPQFDS